MSLTALLMLTLSSRSFETTAVPLDGWTLQVETVLTKDHPREWGAVKRELDKQLYQITRVVPDGPLAKLREVPIWVNWDDAGTTCMAFHPDVGYLRQHKMNPEMARGVEIGNAKNFVSWTYEQPWMVLHELAHAYQFRVLEKGFANSDIQGAYQAAMKSKKYDAVLHWNGKTAKHYAETNAMEYFAESTEAYFGMNDFYPFVNAELKTYDPDTFALMQRIWGEPQKRL